jgi:hypothetical protein
MLMKFFMKLPLRLTLYFPLNLLWGSSLSWPPSHDGRPFTLAGCSTVGCQHREGQRADGEVSLMQYREGWHFGPTHWPFSSICMHRREHSHVIIESQCQWGTTEEARTTIAPIIVHMHDAKHLVVKLGPHIIAVVIRPKTLWRKECLTFLQKELLI